MQCVNLTHCVLKMITTAMLANTFICHIVTITILSYHIISFFAVRTFKIYSLSTFQVRNIELSTVVTIPVLHLVAIPFGSHSLQSYKSREKEITGEGLGGQLHISFAHCPLA